MSYRVFRDSQGTEWQTWDVVPQTADRRVSQRRRESDSSAAVDRRRLPDRRVLPGHRPSVLSAGLDAGWLCFEGPREKRRLSPIPGDWLRCAEERLEQYCRLAKPAPRVSSAVDITGSLHHNTN